MRREEKAIKYRQLELFAIEAKIDSYLPLVDEANFIS